MLFSAAPALSSPLSDNVESKSMHLLWRAARCGSPPARMGAVAVAFDDDDRCADAGEKSTSTASGGSTRRVWGDDLVVVHGGLGEGRFGGTCAHEGGGLVRGGQMALGDAGWPLQFNLAHPLLSARGQALFGANESGTVSVQINDLLRWGTGTMLAVVLVGFILLVLAVVSRMIDLRQLFGAR